MNLTEIIIGLCAIIDQQNAIILDQATVLAQHGALTREEEIAALRQKFADITGDLTEA